MSAFSDCLEDFAVVYYVTIAPYNGKSSPRYHACLSALVFAYFQRASGLFDRFICGTVIELSYTTL